MTITDIFPITFPALVLAHLVALLSPGQDFFLIIGHAIRHGMKGCKYICIGIAAGNFIYIAIAVIGWTSIRAYPLLFNIVECCGAAYLFWLGFQLTKSNKNDALFKSKKVDKPSALKQFSLGLNSALLNPKNALFYITLMTLILGSEVTLLQQVTSGIWMTLMVFVWNLFIASIIGQSKVQTYLKGVVHLVERGAGIILIGFGVILLIDNLKSWLLVL